MERGGAATWYRDRSSGFVYYGGKVMGVAVRHPVYSTCALVFVVMWSGVGFLGAVLLFGVLSSLGGAAWVALRRAEGTPGAPLVSSEDRRAKAALRKQWPLACKSARLLGPETGAPPKLTKVTGNGYGSLTAQASATESGIPASRYTKAADDLAAVIGCREVVVTDKGNGLVELTFHWKDPIGRPYNLDELPIAPPGRIAYGRRQDGSAATINPMQSLLIGGLTRHGKSNIIWTLLGDLTRQGIPTDLYVSDPKDGLELAVIERALAALGHDHDGLIRIRGYAPNEEATAKMVAAAEKACKVRRYELREVDGVRKLEAPTRENPLVVVLLDEMLVLEDMLKKGTNSPLGRLYFMGATAGYVVWGNTQAATLDVLGPLRKYIPQRICVATDAPETTDSILGLRGAEGVGAKCSEINEPGVGYSKEEGDRLPRKFRAPFVSDAETELIARGQLPAKVVNAALEAYDRRAEDQTVAGKSRKDRRTALYRWYYVDNEEYGDSLGYVGVGISYDVLRREQQHSAALREFMEGNVRREVVYYATRAEAEAAEKTAIELERPIHNVVHNGENRRRRFRREKVAA